MRLNDIIGTVYYHVYPKMYVTLHFYIDSELNLRSTLQYDIDDSDSNEAAGDDRLRKRGLDNLGFAAGDEKLGMTARVGNNFNGCDTTQEEGPGKKMTLNKPLEVWTL